MARGLRHGAASEGAHGYEKFFARQPIFDEKLKIFASELLFRAGSQITWFSLSAKPFFAPSKNFLPQCFAGLPQQHGEAGLHKMDIVRQRATW